MAQIDDLLRYLKQHKGSDLHLAAGLEPRIRVHGSLVAVEGQPQLTNEGLRKLLREIASEAQWRSYEQAHDLDFAYGLEGVARFRANFFVQEHGAGAVLRMIPEKIVPLEELKLPKAIEGLVDLRKGLVVVTGPTGSGKSTTLAGIIDKINRSYAKHILTLEDPVEFVHENKKSVISHREVGAHTRGFGPGLRAAIRQDADVVLVGEMRDYETISLALTAAEMGMLVFGTLHTNNAPKTIDRIIDTFPSDEQAQVRLSLAESLAAVVAQLLLPTADGKGRVAANEILLKTKALPNIIREANVSMLGSYIQQGKADGMQQMDDALFEFAQQKRVDPHDAWAKATDKQRFEPLLPKE
ncbi:MAG TPA: type IV pilus twitching motility protein PilT [Myxococcota bacterium]|nr:type IV pilus twitching motility protein PilT [Myxococcota bacterium]